MGVHALVHQVFGHGIVRILADADDRLKTRVLKVLDRMGYKPKIKEAAKEEAPRLTQSPS